MLINSNNASPIVWTHELFVRFKKQYANALAQNKETFIFDGHGFLTPYAGYLIEYLSEKFK